MRVDEFALGFPPRLISRRKGETEYSINAIPIGGYVKIYGENAHGPDPDMRSFPNRPLWSRIAVIVAGVTMNMIFAFVVLSIAFSIGFPSAGLDIDKIPGATITRSDVIVAEVIKDSPAEKAGIEPGDYIRALKDTQSSDTATVHTFQELQTFTQAHQNLGHRNLEVTIEHESVQKTLPVTINATGPALGVAPDDLLVVRLPVWRSPQGAYQVISYIISTTWTALKDFANQLFVHAHLAQGISGPVGIYRVTSQAAQQGFASVIFLTVALSVNLALLNILPIPALDGGKLVFLIIELIFRKRMVSEKIENAFSTVGFAALMVLILIVTLKDVGLF